MFSDSDVRRPADLFGGPRGMIDSGVPPIVFVLVNIWAGLTTAVWSALVAGAVLLLVRVVRREHVRHAVSGFLGVGIAAGIAKLTGEAKNFFVPGIVINLVYGLAFLASAATRHPLVGVILRQISEKPQEWYDHPRVRRAYQEVTLGWAAVFLTRVAVQEPLRRAGKTGWLAVAKIGMGYPLYIAALVFTLPFVNRRTRGVVVATDSHPEEDALPERPFEEAPHE